MDEDPAVSFCGQRCGFGEFSSGGSAFSALSSSPSAAKEFSAVSIAKAKHWGLYPFFPPPSCLFVSPSHDSSISYLFPPTALSFSSVFLFAHLSSLLPPPALRPRNEIKMRPIRSQILGAALTGLFFFSPFFLGCFSKEKELREEGKRHETIRSRAKRGRTLKGGKKKRVEEGEISRRGISQARRGRRGKKAR